MDDKKIAFIYGSDKAEVGIYEGEVCKIGNINDSEIHSTCLLLFAKEKYPEVGIFNKLNYRHRPQSIAYFYTRYFNHAVFLNTTKYRDDGSIGMHGKNGILMLPEELTDKQKEMVSRFLDEINDYSVSILYDLKLDGGIVTGSEILSVDANNSRVAFDNYLDMKSGTKSL